MVTPPTPKKHVVFLCSVTSGKGFTEQLLTTLLKNISAKPLSNGHHFAAAQARFVLLRSGSYSCFYYSSLFRTFNCTLKSWFKCQLFNTPLLITSWLTCKEVLLYCELLLYCWWSAVLHRTVGCCWMEITQEEIILDIQKKPFAPP